MGKRRRGRWQATPAEHGEREEKRRAREQEETGEKKKNTNLDHLVLKLMAIVGCWRTLTALRGPPSTINSVPDINNNAFARLGVYNIHPRSCCLETLVYSLGALG